jgi:hypothetical protein
MTAKHEKQNLLAQQVNSLIFFLVVLLTCRKITALITKSKIPKNKNNKNEQFYIFSLWFAFRKGSQKEKRSQHTFYPT